MACTLTELLLLLQYSYQVCLVQLAALISQHDPKTRYLTLQIRVSWLGSRELLMSDQNKPQSFEHLNTALYKGRVFFTIHRHMDIKIPPKVHRTLFIGYFWCSTAEVEQMYHWAAIWRLHSPYCTPDRCARASANIHTDHSVSWASWLHKEHTIYTFTQHC